MGENEERPCRRRKWCCSWFLKVNMRGYHTGSVAARISNLIAICNRRVASFQRDPPSNKSPSTSTSKNNTIASFNRIKIGERLRNLDMVTWKIIGLAINIVWGRRTYGHDESWRIEDARTQNFDKTPTCFLKFSISKWRHIHVRKAFHFHDSGHRRG